jgi:hypothetical protein
MSERRRYGICWSVGCTAKYMMTVNLKVKRHDGSGQEIMGKFCREHFLVAVEKDFEPFLRFMKEVK